MLGLCFVLVLHASRWFFETCLRFSIYIRAFDDDSVSKTSVSKIKRGAKRCRLCAGRWNTPGMNQ